MMEWLLIAGVALFGIVALLVVADVSSDFKISGRIHKLCKGHRD